jgi:hypothetical protein
MRPGVEIATSYLDKVQGWQPSSPPSAGPTRSAIKRTRRVSALSCGVFDGLSLAFRAASSKFYSRNILQSIAVRLC